MNTDALDELLETEGESPEKFLAISLRFISKISARGNY